MKIGIDGHIQMYQNFIYILAYFPVVVALCLLYFYSNNQHRAAQQQSNSSKEVTSTCITNTPKIFWFGQLYRPFKFEKYTKKIIPKKIYKDRS